MGKNDLVLYMGSNCLICNGFHKRQVLTLSFMTACHGR